MQCHARIPLTQGRPARRRLLHVVLAEDPLAGRQRRFDSLERLALRDGDQRDARRLTPGTVRRLLDSTSNGTKPSRNLVNTVKHSVTFAFYHRYWSPNEILLLSLPTVTL